MAAFQKTQFQFDYGRYDSRYPGLEFNIYGSEERTQKMFLNAVVGTAKIEFPADASPTEIFANLNVLTLHQHESRHLIDYHISPWGSEILRSRLGLLLSTPSALYDLMMQAKCNRGTSIIPIPLAKWGRLSSGKKRAKLQNFISIRKELGDTRELNISKSMFHYRYPKINNRDLTLDVPLGAWGALVESYYYEKSNQILKQSRIRLLGHKFDAISSLEFGAILSQLHLITKFDAGLSEGTNFFSQNFITFLEKAPDSVYTDLTRFFLSLLGVNKENLDEVIAFVRILTLVHFWSLLGDPVTVGFRKSSPIFRLKKLLRSGGKWLEFLANSGGGFSESLQYFDELTGLGESKVVIGRNLDRWLGLLDEIKRRSSVAVFDNQTRNEIELARKVCEAHIATIEPMAKAAMDDNLSLLLDLYQTDIIPEYSDLQLVTVRDGSVPVDDFPAPLCVFDGVETKTGRKYATAFTPMKAERPYLLSPEQAYEYRKLQIERDFLFDHTPGIDVDELAVVALKGFLSESNFVLLWC